MSTPVDVPPAMEEAIISDIELTDEELATVTGGLDIGWWPEDVDPGSPPHTV
jgi:bacteriocin-like protein